MKRNITLFIVIASAVIALDQITKAIITSRFIMYESYKVLDGFFNLVYVMNPGAAFGFLANAPEIFRSIFFTSVTILALMLILYYIIKHKPQSLMLFCSLALIFAGAVGNLIDRLRFGAVVDFLQVYLGFTTLPPWPAFNVADSAITIGAVFMIWDMIANRKKNNVS